MTFSQSATPRRSGRLAPNASVAHVSPIFAGRDTTLSSFVFDNTIPPSLNKTGVIMQFPIKELCGNKMLPHYDTMASKMSSPYLKSPILLTELPNVVAVPFIRSMSNHSLEIVRNGTTRANDEIMDMNLLFSVRNCNKSTEFVSLPVCTLVNFAHIEAQNLSHDESVATVRRLVNQGYYGNNNRPDDVPDLLSASCISFDVNANDHWSKAFVCNVNNGIEDTNRDVTSEFRCILHFDSMAVSLEERPDHSSFEVANQIRSLLNCYKDDDTPELTTITLPVIRVPCKLDIHFIH